MRATDVGNKLSVYTISGGEKSDFFFLLANYHIHACIIDI